MKPPKSDDLDRSFSWRGPRTQPQAAKGAGARSRAVTDRFAHAEWRALAAAIARLPATPRADDEDL